MQSKMNFFRFMVDEAPERGMHECSEECRHFKCNRAIRVVQTSPDRYRSATRHVIRGSSWMIALRWSVRLTGVASTIILARLLTPADYGVVAIATLILGTIEILGQAGQGNAIIRHADPTAAHYNAAWTISLMFGFGLALIVLAATPLTVIYFHEPRAKLVLEVLALRTALNGFQNIGVINFQRNLQFHKQFQFGFVTTLIQFVVVLASALILRNYWALVIGILTKQAATVALSYVMDPFRPRPSFQKIPELFSFSFWNLFRNIGSYAQNQVGKIAIGGFSGAAAMGQFEVGRDLAGSPIAEANGPITYALYSVMAKVQQDRDVRRELLLSVIYWSGLICSSTAVGIALVAGDMVDLLLGHQWAGIKPLIPWFALYYGVSGLTSSTYVALESIGLAGASARMQWFRVLGLSMLIFPTAFYYRGGLLPVAVANFAAGALIMPTLFYTMARCLDVSMLSFARVLWRPFAAAALMAAAVTLANRSLPIAGTLRLLLDSFFGAAIFTGALMVFWYLIGCPKGPEHTVWSQLRRLFAAISARMGTGLRPARAQDSDP